MGRRGRIHNPEGRRGWGIGGRGMIQGRTGNDAQYSEGGAGENGGDRDNSNGGKREEMNGRGPAGEKERQKRRGEVPRGR